MKEDIERSSAAAAAAMMEALSVLLTCVCIRSSRGALFHRSTV
jgi:hypothetical protein